MGNVILRVPKHVPAGSDPERNPRAYIHDPVDVGYDLRRKHNKAGFAARPTSRKRWKGICVLPD